MAKIDPKKEVVKDAGNSQLDQLLQKMDSMEAKMSSMETENQELRKEIDKSKPKDPKKKYEGPRTFAYKKWGGLPVVSWESYAKDPTMKFVDKDPITGKYKENQYLKLNCVGKDKKNVEFDVLAVSFGADVQKSEHLEAEVLMNGTEVAGYKFNVEPFGEFTVLPKFIN